MAKDSTKKIIQVIQNLFTRVYICRLVDTDENEENKDEYIRRITCKKKYCVL